MLFVSKKSKNNRILHRGHVCLAGKADNAWQSETCRSWEVSLVSGQLKSPRAQLSTPTEHKSFQMDHNSHPLGISSRKGWERARPSKKAKALCSNWVLDPEKHS